MRVARDHCLAPARPVDAPLVGFEGRYGRMFPDLPPLAVDDERLLALGLAGAACGTGEDDDALDGREAAGWPVFGQFVAHDITADRSPLQAEADPVRLGSFRSPRANLECLYGAGPGSPYLYRRDDPAAFLTGADDVPRNAEGTALLGDPRNDVHVLVSQLHLAFLRLHNLFVERLREDGVAEGDLFGEARLATMWHYQWVLVNDFLPRLVGQDLADDALAHGPKYYAVDGDPYIPFEFADAAYRYGHSQIRARYKVNVEAEPVPLFPDLGGFQPVPTALKVDWAFLFDLPGRPAAQRAKRIDGCLPASLLRLPLSITGEVDVDAYHSLASRDLQRGRAIGLPSGEAVAGTIDAEPLTSHEVGLAAHGWDGETPLWFYVLREADVRGDGDRLGPVGGRIVTDVLVGIVRADAESFLSVDPDWTPTLAGEGGGEFGIGELLDAVYAPGRTSPAS
jgi:Animal haem peroxidase